MSEEGSADKEHEPSQRKLDQARSRGELPRSSDLLAAASLAGFLLAGGITGAGAIGALGSAGQTALSQAHRIAGDSSGIGSSARTLALDMVLPLWPIWVLPMLLVLTMLTLTRAWVFAPSRVAFRLDRISPVSTFKQKYGRTGLFEFAKNLLKLGVVSFILLRFVLSRMDLILGMQRLTAAQAIASMLRMMLEFLALALCLAIVIGGVDYLFQWFDHRRRNRMSRKELTDEARESEGDPHQKAARRQRAEEVATNRMIADVAKADVVIVNPTHYAVALKWARGDRNAPVCLAKGVDEIAARIREIAARHAVPVHSDPPTARLLHATVEIGHEIRPEQYRAVAAAIRFSEAMRKRAREGRMR